jgi:hypothetical protein
MPAASGRPEALTQELVGRAHRWADAVAPGEVLHAGQGLGAAGGLGAAVGGLGATVGGLGAVGDLGAAVGGLFSGGDPRPVLVVWPELVRWRPDHAAGALDDLADGCALSLGPMFDGGFYLAAFARPLPALLELPDDVWRSRDPLGLAARAARESGGAVGLLRTERGLRTPADISALRADPLLDDELRGLLG